MLGHGPEAIRAFRRARVGHIAAERRLVGIHFLEALIGTDEKPNVAVIMAGGEGRRLRPLTDTIPKPMVHVAGRPILERIVLHLVNAMKRLGTRRGIATECIGGGLGGAMLIETV